MYGSHLNIVTTISCRKEFCCGTANCSGEDVRNLAGGSWLFCDKGYEFWDKAKAYLNFCCSALNVFDYKHVWSVAFTLVPILLLLD